LIKFIGTNEVLAYRQAGATNIPRAQAPRTGACGEFQIPNI